MTNIFIVGFMGSGKSTVGKKLASKLDMKFIDLDKHIESSINQSIPNYFDLNGEEKFRELEKKILIALFKEENAVISCGGGTACFYDNMDQMNQNGLTIYLKMSVEMLVSRLVEAKEQRPLIAGKSKKELTEYISKQLDKRDYYYKKAHYTVKSKDIDVVVLADFLKKELQLA